MASFLRCLVGKCPENDKENNGGNSALLVAEKTNAASRAEPEKSVENDKAKIDEDDNSASTSDVEIANKLAATSTKESDNGAISPVIQTTNLSCVLSSRPRADVRPNGKDTRSNAEHKVERK